MPLDPSVLDTSETASPNAVRQKNKVASNLDSLLKTEGAEHLAPIVQAIYGQETGHGANSRTSTDGARGPMQVMPGTFKQLARQGESIDNPDDNMRVGIRLIKTLGDKFNNDPARIAAGYFSGEGNVNRDGDQVIKRDHADGNGKRVSAYVQDVLARVGDAVVPSARAAEPVQKQARLVDEVRRAEADPLAALSLFKDNPAERGTPVAAGDQALTESKKQPPAAGRPMPRREEVTIRDMLAGKSPEDLARIAGQGGLPGRVAQALLESGKGAEKQPELGRDFRSFDELAASPGYRDLAPEQKDQARQRYFAERIAPGLTEDKQQAAWQQFEQKTRPGVIDRAVGSAKDILGRMADPLEPDRREHAIRKMLAQQGDEQLQRIAGQGGTAGKVAKGVLQERQAQEPVQRFAADKAMHGNKLGKSTPDGIEVLNSQGQLIGHYR